MDLALVRPDIISLAAGFTDNPTLPVEEARTLFRDLLEDRVSAEAALQYGNTPGLRELCQRSAARLERLDQPSPGPARVYSPDSFIITHGSQQLLYMVTEVLCDPGDVVLLEDPTYFVYLGIAQSHGLECRGIPLEPDGLDLGALERALNRLKREGRLHRVKLLYLVSYHQNPTGTTTSWEKKARALDLLRSYERSAGHPIYVLEDAAYRELRFAGADVPSALATPMSEARVIYTSTYSKPFATGVRVGFARLPEAIRVPVSRVKGNHDFGTSSLLQHLLSRALASGRYESHLEQLRLRYAEKAGWMLDALGSRFPAEAAWRRPAGGMYVWVRLPRHRSTGLRSELFQRALAHDVLYVPGRLCYATDPTRRAPDHELRLSFGSASREAIDQGIARLADALIGAPAARPAPRPRRPRRTANRRA
ncbi:MAG TPA: PLP-dependent aminotransferase family protein [Verrucomicrobiota bacterium]|nr:PLP-dependent aminotransferase family protein [Verrucomicrobiota bacterium]HNU49318.1 PLP-dependent aminotransferase family protein [Verrucomicrobiota bacterium]